MLLSGGGAQSAAAVGQGASVDTGAVASTPVFQWNMNVATRETREVLPTNTFAAQARTEWLLEADNVPGRFWDLSRSKLIFRANASGIAGTPSLTPIFNSGLLFKQWMLHIGGVNLSEQNMGYDQYAAWAKTALLEPENLCPVVETTGASLQGNPYFLNHKASRGIVTPPALHNVGGSGVKWSQNAVREPILRYLEDQNNYLEIEVFLPHPIFHQPGMVPSSFQVRLCAEIIDLTWQYMCAVLAGETITITPVSCNWYVPVVELTAPGLKLYQESLMKTNGELKLPCLRTELHVQTLTTTQTVFNWSLLGKRVPSAICVHLVDANHANPSSKASDDHPFERSIGNPPRINQFRVRAAGRTFPNNYAQAVERANVAPYNSGGTVALDNEVYRELTRVYRTYGQDMGPLFQMETIQTAQNQSIFFVNLQENHDSAVGTRAPMDTIGPIEFYLSLHANLGTNYLAFITLFYSDQIIINPVRRAVMPGW